MFPYVDVHTHQPCGRAIELTAFQTPDKYEGFCSLGIHPWHTSELTQEQAEQELRMVESAKVAAIGEIGADTLRGGTMEWQLELLERQLQIAQHRELPVIIHSVKAFEPIMNCLERHTLRAVVFHSWIGSEQQATQAIKRGYRLSFGPRSLASSRNIATLRSIAPQALLLESDDSGVPIEQVYSQVAQLRSVSEEQLREEVFNNFKDIWQNGWSVPSYCSVTTK